MVLTDASIRNTSGSMPTLTLKVPQATAARLERMALRRRTSKSAVLREALDEKLRRASDEPSLYELMMPSLGSLASKVSDLGHNPKHLAGFGRR
ncbi:MAG: ribbon-helix-helix protein, CopG family [Opitutaceae bacterium]